MLLYLKFIKIFKIFIDCKNFFFSKPKKADIVIFNTRYGIFENIITNKSLKLHHLMHNFSDINLFVVFKVLTNFNIFKINYKENSLKLSSLYFIEYIKSVNPKLVLTFSDNNLEFYSFKKFTPGIKFSFVQNGFRISRLDIFEKFNLNATYEVDYMFVFNEAVGKEYNKYIRGEYIANGSIKNNSVELVGHQYYDHIMYISQYLTGEKDHKDSVMYKFTDNEVITYEDFYYHDSVILNFLKEFCIQNNHPLKILGRFDIDDKVINKEIIFYNKILGDFKWTYIRNLGEFHSYTLMDKNLILISADSTLGLEALARNKKIIMFPFRHIKISDPFGWPSKFDDVGVFWSDINSKEIFFKIVSDALNSDINSWKKSIKPYKDQIMSFDQNNNIFNNKLKKIFNY